MRFQNTELTESEKALEREKERRRKELGGQLTFDTPPPKEDSIDWYAILFFFFCSVWLAVSGAGIADFGFWPKDDGGDYSDECADCGVVDVAIEKAAVNGAWIEVLHFWEVGLMEVFIGWLR